MLDKRITPSLHVMLCSAFGAFAGCAAPVPHFDAGQNAARVKPWYLCARATGTIQIDGRPKEIAWARAGEIGPFVDISETAAARGGPAMRPPRFKTTARMLWDDHYLYIAAELEEPNLRARLMDRDSIVFHDNDFEVFIDPDGDGRNYFEIEINAHNTIFDLMLVRSYREGGPAKHDWDASGLRTAVAIDGTLNDPGDRDRGWTLEMAIPWSALAEHAGCRAPPRAGDVWRMNFSRVQWPDDLPGGAAELVGRGIEDNWVWSPIGEVDMHVPEKWAWVEFEG